MPKTPIKSCELTITIGGQRRCLTLQGFEIANRAGRLEIRGNAGPTALTLQAAVPRTSEVTVTVEGVERRFTLRSKSINEVLNLLEVQERAWNAAVEECKGAVGEDMTVLLSSKAYLEALAPRVIPLLQEPADDGAPLTAEQFWLLEPEDPHLVLEAQNVLVNLDQLTAHAMVLRTQAKNRMIREIEEGLSLLDETKGE